MGNMGSAICWFHTKEMAHWQRTSEAKAKSVQPGQDQRGGEPQPEALFGVNGETCGGRWQGLPSLPLPLCPLNTRVRP